LAREAEWKAHEGSNFNKAQWRGPNASGGGWEVTPPVSPVSEIDVIGGSTWPGVSVLMDGCGDTWPSSAKLVKARCDAWPGFSSDTIEIKVAVEEHSSIGECAEGHSACRFYDIVCLFGC
jgi:hypothetical protein